MMIPADSERRLVLLRMGIAGYVAVWSAVRAPHLLGTTDFAARRFDPVGPLAFLDVPLPRFVVVLGVVLTPLAAAAMAAGMIPRISGPVAATSFLFVTTYRNSWGHLIHTENLVALHLVVLALVPFRRGDREAFVQALAVLTVGTYFLAGVAKLRISGTAWLDGDVLRNQIAFDNARKVLLGDPASPLAAWSLRQDWMLAPAALMTMVVELGAPLALLHRRIAYGWSALAVAFHFAILAFMAILFPYHLLGLALAPLLPLERVGREARWPRQLRSRDVSRDPHVAH